MAHMPMQQQPAAVSCRHACRDAKCKCPQNTTHKGFRFRVALNTIKRVLVATTSKSGPIARTGF